MVERHPARRRRCGGGQPWLGQGGPHAFVLGLPGPGSRFLGQPGLAGRGVGLHPGPAGRDRVIAPRVTEAQSPQGSLQLDQRRSGYLRPPGRPGSSAPGRGCKRGWGRAVPPGIRGRAGGRSGDHGARLSTRSDHVGLGDPAVRLGPDVHRMPGRDRCCHRPVLAHRDGPFVGQAGQGGEPGDVPGAPLGEDHRPLGAGQQLGRAGQQGGVRAGRGRGHGRQRLQGGRRARLAQDLSWKAQVHRSAGVDMAANGRQDALLGAPRVLAPLLVFRRTSPNEGQPSHPAGGLSTILSTFGTAAAGTPADRSGLRRPYRRATQPGLFTIVSTSDDGRSSDLPVR